MQDNSIAIKATAICKMLTCHYYMYVRRKFYHTKEAQVYIIISCINNVGKSTFVSS